MLGEAPCIACLHSLKSPAYRFYSRLAGTHLGPLDIPLSMALRILACKSSEKAFMHQRCAGSILPYERRSTLSRYPHRC